MSTVKAKNHQIGADGTASNNFTIYQPSTPDGTSRWAVGVSGATTADVVTVNSSGNVGIGTASPSAKFHVRASSTGSTANGIMLDAGAQQHSWYLSDNTTSAFTIGSTAGQFTWANSGGERMRIDSSGRVLVGTTSSGGLGGLTTIPNYDGDTAGLIWNKSNSTSTAAVEFRYNGTQKGYIAYTSTTTTYNTTSDYRLKTDVKPMIDALDTVAKLKPVTYKWIEDNSNGQGFIAHELQEVVPECVNGQKDAVNEDGSIKPQGIDTSFLVATLTAAIQELTKRVQELEAKVN